MTKKRIKRSKPLHGYKKPKIKTLLFLLFSCVVIAAAFFVSSLDTKVMPTVLSIVEVTAKNRINTAIDLALQKTTNQHTIDPNDFYLKTTDETGMINSLSVNTVLVNSICSQMATHVSAELAQSGSQSIQIPLGTILNIRAFSNTGPTYPISVLPMGDAMVDYETSFEAVGINQINFQLWLRIDSSVRVVNPFQPTDITVSRKIALVNTVFSGKVPDTYLNNTPVFPLQGPAE